MHKIHKIGCLCSLFILLGGCGKITAPKINKSPAEQAAARIVVSRPFSSLEPVEGHDIPPLADDLDSQSLSLAIERSLQYFNRLNSRDVYLLGDHRYTIREMKETLAAFSAIISSGEPEGVKESQIRKNFSFFRSRGDNGTGRVIFTGYYEPILNGSWSKTKRYSYPLYRLPEETVLINLGKFSEKYKNEQLVGRVQRREVVPHYKRADIDGANSLAGRNLEIIWVDNIVDLFFLHIQGSGKIRLPNGSLVQVGYAQSNGHPYRSIGRLMIENGQLAGTEQSLQAIKKYLLEHPEETAQILNYNERYVFFRLLDHGAVGSLNVPVTGGRTIAADPEVYPRGALAFIRTRKPEIRQGKLTGWNPFSRFVLNQDTGKAISGSGRIDLFCGSGEEAEAVAGRLKEAGELFFLIKKGDGKRF